MYFNWSDNVIIDNIEVDWGGYTSQGVTAHNGTNWTMNDLSTYDNYSNHGFYAGGSYWLLNNSQTYSNGEWGSWGDAGVYIRGNHIVVNNLQSYNNQSWLRGASTSTYNIINNSQIYNNDEMWVDIRWWDLTLNNVMIYSNNNMGMYFDLSSDIVINSAQVFNNNVYGLRNAGATVTYYWALKFFDNTSNSNGTLTAGSSSTYSSLWRAWWTLDTSSETLSYEWITRARNEDGNYGPFSSYSTRSSTYSWSPTAKYYSYGNYVSKQIQPVFYDSTALSLSNTVEYDEDKYIAQHNGWSNEYFLDDSFWDSDPSDEDVIWALYGDGDGGVDNTAYTEHWDSNSCVTGDMSVSYISPWVNTLPATILADTIYVLSNWTYNMWSATRNLNNCAAVVGSTWSSKTCNTAQVANTFYSNAKSNTIIGDVDLNWSYNCSLGSHANNDYGVNYNASSGNTIDSVIIHDMEEAWIYYGGTNRYNVINNSNIYDVKSYGVYYYILTNGAYTYNNIINNSNIYNNNYGVYYRNTADTTHTRYNMINNSNIYNNVGRGIWYYLNAAGDKVSSISYNTINNSNIYNNGGYGIWYYLRSHDNMPSNAIYFNHNVVNNSNIYNNDNHGIYAYKQRSQGLTTDNKVNNSNIYNNGSYAIYLNNWSPVYYYGELKMFDNVNTTYGTLTAGSSSTYSSLWRAWWTINTDGCMTCDWYVNPMWYSSYLMNTGTYPTCTGRWDFPTWNPDIVSMDHLFGSFIPKQESVVEYPGTTTLSLSDLSIDDAEYIWEADNRSGEYYGNYMCNGCEADSYYRWDNDNFVTQTGFWDNDPTECEIIAALYGTSAVDETAYTKNWNGYDGSCSVASGDMDVEYVSAWVGNIPHQLLWDTIYVLASGSHEYYYAGNSYGIYMDDCSAVVWDGDVELSSSSTLSRAMIYSDDDDYGIVDNINIDWAVWHLTNLNENWIRFLQLDNGTINNVQSSNHDGVGIDLDYANYITINNTQTNNADQRGVRLTHADNATINNVQAYNTDIWIRLEYSDDVVINNTQLYNCIDWLDVVSSNNFIINNSQAYNNSFYWLNISNTNDIVVNNTHSYNNKNWYRFAGGGWHKYYDEIVLFENSNGNLLGSDGFDSTFSPWLSSDYTGMLENGLLSTNGCMSCAWVTNPIDGSGTPFINTWTYPNCEMIWQNASRDEAADGYVYGEMINLQKEALKYYGAVLSFYNMPIMADNYIWEINNIGEYTWGACDCSTVTYRWDNDNFVTQTGFWGHSPAPTYCDIIVALYGTWEWDETAYTQHRSGYDLSCSLASGAMNVEYIPAWNGNIANQLSWDTIYVLSTGDHLYSLSNDGVFMSGCNTIIWNWDVYMYSTWQIWSYWTINNLNHQYNIIDNVKIDGEADGDGGSHTANQYGIYFDGANNGIINNNQVYNNNYGISFDDSDNGAINNSQSYNNNGVGIYFVSSLEGIINNSQSYNNNSIGIFFASSDNGAINNTHSYNNNEGIYFTSSDNGAINNTHSYNNNNGGMSFSSSDDGVINNIYSYNNSVWVYYNAVWHRYYWDLKLFDNDDDLSWTDGFDGSLTWWLASDYPWLWRESGYINTGGCMTCDWYTNPQNNLWEFLINTWDYEMCERRWYTGDWTSTWEVGYLYGSLISKQTTGVYYTGWNIEFSDLYYDPTWFIAEYNKIWEFEWNYACNCDTLWRDNDNFITQTGFWDHSPAPTYCDIVAALYGTWAWDETAYTQHWSGYDLSCSLASGSMNVEYIPAWNGNIANQLSWDTIYVLSTGDHLYSLSNDGVFMSGCNTIIWNWDVYMYSTWQIWSYWTINNLNHQYNIIDNVKIDGEADGDGGSHTANQYGIYLSEAESNTINKVETYHNNNRWINLSMLSDYNHINNCSSFDNLNYGMYVDNSSYNLFDKCAIYNNKWVGGFRINNWADYNIINNTLIYNNAKDVISTDARKWWWLQIEWSDYNSINNTQIFNNHANHINHAWLSVYTNSNYNSFDNVLVYNNEENWIYMHGSSNYNVYNNVKSYNNEVWFKTYSTSTSNKYYGVFELFENDDDLSWTDGFDGNLTWWLASDFVSLWREDGSIGTDGCMTCDVYTNAQNNLDTFLMDTGLYLTCTGRWSDPSWIWTGTSDVGYLYGSLISKQTTGVYYTGWDLEYSSLFYDPTNFVAEINSLWVYTGTYSCNCDLDNLRRDNDDFITQTGFWEHSPAPTYCDIVAALYGTWEWDETAYTQHWSGYDLSCSLASGDMNVEYIPAWNGNIANQLSWDTIYVLSTGDHLYSLSNDGVFMSGCNTIIWNWDVYMYSTWQIWSYWTINNLNHQYNIIDNVKIDGEGDGDGGTHTANQYGIYVYSGSNTTVNNTKTFEHTNAWIKIKRWDVNIADYNLLHNVQSYNNSLWIFVDGAYNLINNVKTYNNKSYGVNIDVGSQRNSIMNLQSYNNATNWVQTKWDQYTVLKNVWSYNNGVDGVAIWSTVGGVISNVYAYNNDEKWIYANGSAVTYYDNIRVFENGSWNMSFGWWWYFVQWSGSDFGGIFATGSIQEYGCMTCDWYANPRNSTWLFFMNTWTYPECDERWNDPSGDWTSTWEVDYLYGSLLWNQMTWVRYNTVPTVVSVDVVYDSTSFVAEINKIWVYTGDYDCNCDPWLSTWWDNSSFLTWEFWNHIPEPTYCDIVISLYGTWVWDETVYTENWTWRSNQCNLGNMDIEYMTEWTSTMPLVLTANTIYVLSGGDYINTGTVEMQDCNVIVGKDNVYMYSTWYLGAWMIASTSVLYDIIDNIKVDGEWDGAGVDHSLNKYGIYIKGDGNVSVNAVELYNNLTALYVKTKYSSFDNIQTYNNEDGVKFDIWANSYNISNNIQSYNNSGVGLYMLSTYDTLNNLQIHNNQKGVEITKSDYSVISNANIYSNTSGWIDYYTMSNDGLLNNVSVYNNTEYGISFDATSTGHKYYSGLTLFGNTVNMTGTDGSDDVLTGWLAGDTEVSGLWWGDGIIDVAWCMTCDWFTNPLNNAWEYLINTGTYPLCEFVWFNSWIWTGEIDYVYGEALPNQIQPVKYMWTSLIDSSIEYFDTEYLAEINKVGTYSGWSCGCDTQYYRWDNDEYVTQSGFWDHSPAPTYCDVIVAVYGTWVGDTTPYTENWTWWTNQCNLDNMVVEYVSTGEDMIPENLSGNTIYVLESGHYNFTYTSGVYMSGCSVIMWKDHTYLHSETEITWRWLINNMWYSFNVLDNLNIDGKHDWLWVEHADISNIKNKYWIVLESGDNTTINNIRLYESNFLWISMSWSDYTLIANSQIYNNKLYGISTTYSTNNIIDNTQIYNNNQVWIVYQYVSNSVLSNSQVYNNKHDGIAYKHVCTNNIISNTQIYNNANAWVYYYNLSNDNILYNVSSFNNKHGLFFEGSSTWNKYYGTLGLFNSYTDYNYSTDGHDDVLTGWLAGDAEVSGLWWSDGVVSDMWQCMNCTWITNPINPDWEYLIDTGTYPSCDKQWSDLTWLSTGQNTYKYGDEVKTQTWVYYYNISNDIVVSNLPYTLVDYIAERYNVWEYTDDLSCGVYMYNFLFWTWSTPVSGEVLPYNYFDTQIHIATWSFTDFDYMFSGTNYPGATYDIYDSGLVLMMNFDDVSALWEDSTTVKDLSIYNHTWSNVWTPQYSATGKYNKSFLWDWTANYWSVPNYSTLHMTGDQTICLWLKPASLDYRMNPYDKDYRGEWAITQETNGRLNYFVWTWFGGGSVYQALSTTLGSIVSGEWIHACAVRDLRGVTPTLKWYLDGILNASAWALYTESRVSDVPTFIGSGYTWSWYEWKIDELRIYNRVLSQDEVQMLYRSNLNKYDVEDWDFNVRNTCLAVTGVYQFSGYADAVTMRDEIGRTVYTDIPAFNVTWMTDYDFGTLSVSSSAQVVTWWYTGYVEMHDWRAETGWYTTVQFSDVMTGLNNPANVISWENFEFAYSWLVVLSWFESSYVSLNTWLQDFVEITTPSPPRTYMKREQDVNDLMCNAWVYGDMPQFELTIPAYQAVDTYSWVLTVDIRY